MTVADRRYGLGGVSLEFGVALEGEHDGAHLVALGEDDLVEFALLSWSRRRCSSRIASRTVASSAFVTRTLFAGSVIAIGTIGIVADGPMASASTFCPRCRRHCGSYESCGGA